MEGSWRGRSRIIEMAEESAGQVDCGGVLASRALYVMLTRQ